MSDKDSIEVVPYDPSWPSAFAKEKMKLEVVFDEGSIEHIGSTAVPGLEAKPIIDIMVSVDEIQDPYAYEAKLAPLGYEFVLRDGGRLFFRKGHPRTHHLHIVRKGSCDPLRHTVFRDHLISHPEVAKEYEKLKRDLARRYRNERLKYAEGKSAFIQRVMEEALARIN